MADIAQCDQESDNEENMIHVRYGAYQEMVQADHSSKYVYLLQKGWAVRYRLMADGRRQITSLHIPGDVCGLYWLHGNDDGQPLQAIGEVHALKVPCADLLHLAQSRTRYFYGLTAEIQLLSSLLSEHGVTLGRRTAAERLAHVFCELHERMSTAGLANNGEFSMPLTQIDLADLTGLTSIHVNRVLQQMRGAKLIELNSRRLKIVDRDRLNRLAMFDPRYLSGLTKQRLRHAFSDDRNHHTISESVK
jgi:CRP-like cAMP-binding protein